MEAKDYGRKPLTNYDIRKGSVEVTEAKALR
jgi:hypothetical protein